MARNLFIRRVHAQRKIRRGHMRWMHFAGIVCVRNHVLGGDILGAPLNGTSGAVHLLVLILEQHLEIAHIPLRRIGFPGAIKAAGRGIAAFAATVLIDPAKAHGFHGRCFGFGPDQSGIARAMHLAKCVTASYQCHGLIVVHCHTGKGFAHVATRCNRIGLAVRTLGVHIDQTHLHRCKRTLEYAITAIAAVGFVAGGQPFFLHTPEHIFLRSPNISAAAAKAKGLKAHGFHSHITCQDKQVGPGNSVAILFLDRPQEAAGLVQVAVVRPAVQRCKAMVTGVGAATAIGSAVSTRRMPRHTDHQAAVMAPVCRPPVLRIGHQRDHVLLEGCEIQFLEGFGIAVACIHRVGHRLMLMQYRQV